MVLYKLKLKIEIILSFGTGLSRSQGVAILINKCLQFRLRKEVMDEEGRLVIIVADIQGQTLILANVFTPRMDEANLFVDKSKFHDIVLSF